MTLLARKQTTEAALIKSPIESYGKGLKFKTPKFLTNMTYANSADPDQTAPEGAV